MPNIHKIHPEKWFTPFRPIASGHLAPDETLALAMMFTVEVKNKPIGHSIFTVTRKGNKVIGRTINIHLDNAKIMEHGNQECPGHPADIVEYDLSEEQNLTEEVMHQTMFLIAQLVMDEDTPITVDINKPVFCMKIPEKISNEEIYKKLMQHTAQEGEIPKQAIIKALGLGIEKKFPTLTALAKIEEEATKETVILRKAAEEADLIKKYGKKRIENLAKKMNYIGSLINNKDNHAKS